MLCFLKLIFLINLSVGVVTWRFRDSTGLLWSPGKARRHLCFLAKTTKSRKAPTTSKIAIIEPSISPRRVPKRVVKKFGGIVNRKTEHIGENLQLAPLSTTSKSAAAFTICLTKLDQAIADSVDAGACMRKAAFSRSQQELSSFAKACLMYLSEAGTSSTKKDHQQAARLGAKVFPFLQQASVSPELSCHAAWLLSLCHKYGLGTEAHPAEAARLLRCAAEAGSKYAQNGLGYGYYTEGNYEEAARWYLRAAAQGLASAQCNLGSCYYEGRGLDCSADLAVHWWRKAAAQGAASAQFNLAVHLGSSFSNSTTTTTNSSSSSSSSSARELLTQAARQNHAAAMLKLALEYGEGEAQAADYLQRAALLGHPAAQCALAAAWQ
eukprot:gene36034-43701_t